MEGDSKTTMEAVQPTQTDITTLEEAERKVAEGTRHAKCGEDARAADCFGQALGFYVSKYGELGTECAPIYYSYGEALVYQGREELSLFAENAGKDDKEAEAEEEQEDGDDDEDEEGDGDAEDQDDLGEGPEQTLQLAWEVLECARVIYERENNLAALAKTHRLLGELASISDRFTQGAEDLTKAIALANQSGTFSQRQIAEMQYLLGLTHFSAKSYPEAREAYCQALETVRNEIEVLEQRQASMLTGKGKEPATEETEDISGPEAKSLAELKSLLPDLEEKVQELADLQKEMEREEAEKKKRLKALMSEAYSAFLGQGTEGNSNPFAVGSSSGSTSTSAPAIDLAALVGGRRINTTTTTTTTTLKTNGSSDANASAPVNDLSSLVKKRVPTTETAKEATGSEGVDGGSGEKRAGETNGEGTVKRAKLQQL